MSDRTSLITNVPQEQSAEWLYSTATTTLHSPYRGSINMYCITTTQSLPCRSSPGCVIHVTRGWTRSPRCPTRRSGGGRSSTGGRLVDTYHWDSPRRWSLSLRGGLAETAYILVHRDKNIMNKNSSIKIFFCIFWKWRFTPLHLFATLLLYSNFKPAYDHIIQYKTHFKSCCCPERLPL